MFLGVESHEYRSPQSTAELHLLMKGGAALMGAEAEIISRVTTYYVVVAS
jgi:hypothetical protein